jgi:type VI secretion system protein
VTKLTLNLVDVAGAPEGAPGSFSPGGDRAVLGRSPNCDWHLPDPANTVSSRHAELKRAGDNWILLDSSTNGTFLNGSAERLQGEHPLKAGDRIRIGPYQMEVALEAASTAASGPVEEPAKPAASSEPPPDNVTVMWDSLADINKVDWARAGLGASSQGGTTTEGGDAFDEMLAALALEEASVDRSPELPNRAGSLLRRLVAGLVVMVEARARAKAQMGAEATGLQLEGNNPIKFARSPEQALAQLLREPESGFMPPERAVDDAFLDLQSHQVATLRAIPGALRATLDRFSPGSIRRRAEGAGILARILPALQDAALWRNYEREFVRVKNESDEAFMEVFSKEFRKAYDRQLREGLEDTRR